MIKNDKNDCSIMIKFDIDKDKSRRFSTRIARYLCHILEKKVGTSYRFFCH